MSNMEYSSPTTATPIAIYVRTKITPRERHGNAYRCCVLFYNIIMLRFMDINVRNRSSSAQDLAAAGAERCRTTSDHAKRLLIYITLERLYCGCIYVWQHFFCNAIQSAFFVKIKKRSVCTHVAGVSIWSVIFSACGSFFACVRVCLVLCFSCSFVPPSARSSNYQTKSSCRLHNSAYTDLPARARGTYHRLRVRAPRGEFFGT